MKLKIVEQRCGGFFSDFNLITGSLNYLYQNNLKDFYFVWNNYRYQDDNSNLFDEFFFKQTIADENFDRIVRSEDIGLDLVGSFVPEKENCRILNRTLVNCGFFENPHYKKCATSCVFRENVLGVHVRKTDHYAHGDILSDDYYYSKIEERLDQYNFLFLATDDVDVLSNFLKRYGGKLIYNDSVFRSRGKVAIHDINHTDKKKIILDVMMDGISLSKCKELIFTASNVAAFALYLNPEIEFNQIDKHVVRK